jgi:hypothetical protein
VTEEELPQDAITYVTLLSAFQVVLNCQLELKGTNYDQGKSLNKVREAINSLNLQRVNSGRTNAANRDTIWKNDEVLAADIMYAIEIIGEKIAKDNAKALQLVTMLYRKGIDLDKCKIVEMSDDEYREYQRELAERI